MADLDDLLAQHPEVAGDEGATLLLFLERLLQPDPPRYDPVSLSEKTGVDLETLARLWGAMGFPAPGLDQPMAGEADVEIISHVKDDLVDPVRFERLLHQLRIFSSSLARMAEAAADGLVEDLAQLRSAGLSDAEAASALLERSEMLEIERLLFHLYSIQLLAALRRRLTVPDPGALQQQLAVGFVDLVDFTAVSQELEPDELAAMVAEFESRSQETVAEEGARLVKSIGDEIMFSTPSPEVAVRVALRLARDQRRGPLTPDVRGGVAFGPVLARWGDEFGPVVNLASRLLNIAYPGSVIVSDEVHDALVDDPGLAWRQLKPRRLKGIGRVGSWVVRSAEEKADTEE
jgi:adenylate cyclase